MINEKRLEEISTKHLDDRMNLGEYNKLSLSDFEELCRLAKKGLWVNKFSFVIAYGLERVALGTDMTADISIAAYNAVREFPKDKTVEEILK